MQHVALLELVRRCIENMQPGQVGSRVDKSHHILQLVAEPESALAELSRVLRPGARLAILEFGQPRIPGIRTCYTWYFRYLLPLVGRFVSKHDSAYSYLPASVGTFPPPSEFARVIARNGFTNVQAVPLTMGIVYLYVAERN